VRQLITRIDDDLHGLVRERARRAGTSVNAYVTALLREATSGDDAKAVLREDLRAAGRLIVPEATGPPPGRDEVIARLRGASDVVLAAIEGGRAPR
jgi:hypothetical protein